MESFRKKEIMGNLPLKTPRQAGTISKRSIENQVRPIKRDKKQVCLEGLQFGQFQDSNIENCVLNEPSPGL